MKSMDREEIKRAILENVESVLDQAGEKYDAVGAQAAEYYDDAKEAIVDSRRKTVDRIRKNPEQSVLIAAGVGAAVALIASYIFNGRRR